MQTTPRRRRDIRADTGRITHLTERQRRLFDLLDPFWHFKYLTSKWAHQFIGGNEHAFKVMLRNLFDAGYLERSRQQRYSPNSNYKHLVYERTAKAAHTLSDGDSAARALSHRSNSYPHELMVDLGFYAPLWYAATRDPALKLYTASDLFCGAVFTIRTPQGPQRLAVPDATRFLADPFLIRLSSKDTMRFDGTPFVLERTMPDGSTSLIFVPGIEVDRTTEPLQSKDPARTTLAKHLAQVIALFNERGFVRHYGFPMMMVPVITTNEAHTANAMRFVEEKIGAARYLLFKTLPDLAHQPHFPAPSDEYFTSPWLRVGYPPFQFDEAGFT